MTEECEGSVCMSGGWTAELSCGLNHLRTVSPVVRLTSGSPGGRVQSQFGAKPYSVSRRAAKCSWLGPVAHGDPCCDPRSQSGQTVDPLAPLSHEIYDMILWWYDFRYKINKYHIIYTVYVIIISKICIKVMAKDKWAMKEVELNSYNKKINLKIWRYPVSSRASLLRAASTGRVTVDKTNEINILSHTRIQLTLIYWSELIWSQFCRRLEIQNVLDWIS